MKLFIERPVVVITPTTGSEKLTDAILSVQAQTHNNITHLIVADGYDFENATRAAIRKAWQSMPEGTEKTTKMLTLPYNTGASGFNGQRIYASVPHLVDHDYVFFLDQDNWYEPDHVRSLVEKIESENLDWTHSLRKIYDEQGNFITEDNCESLGRWPIWMTHDNPQYMVDTSTYAFRRDFIQKTCHLWHSGAWGEDRRYFYSIAEHSRWNTSTKHTLNYRLGGNENSVGAGFFLEGNRKQLEHYHGKLPWLEEGENKR